MKRTISVLAMLAFTIPALANINITAVDEGGGTVAVNYASTDANLPRGFILDVSTDSGAGINSATDFNTDYWVHHGSLDVNTTTGLIDDYGAPIVGTLPADSIIVEMCSLYDMQLGPPPPASGTLLKFTINKSCNISIAENTEGGGVVMEDTTRAVTNLPASFPVNVGCLTCTGDLNGDSWVKLQDWSILKNKLNQKKSQAGTYDIASGDPLYDPCGDMNSDQRLKMADWFILKGRLNKQKATTGSYDIPCPG